MKFITQKTKRKYFVCLVFKITNNNTVKYSVDEICFGLDFLFSPSLVSFCSDGLKHVIFFIWIQEERFSFDVFFVKINLNSVNKTNKNKGCPNYTIFQKQRKRGGKKTTLKWINIQRNKHNTQKKEKKDSKKNNS